MVEEHDYAVMGGAAESVTTYLKERYTPGLARNEALTLAAAALGQNETGHRDIPAHDLEVAVLDRTRTQERKFRRVAGPVLVELLGNEASAATEPEPTAPQAEGPAADAPEATGDEPPIAP